MSARRAAAPPLRASAAILAGGRSERMGFDKARARIAGHTLIERGVGALAGSVREVLVVANDARRLGLPRLRAAAGRRGAAFRTLADHGRAAERPMGPLGGLVAAVAGARYDPVLVTAVDLVEVEPGSVARAAAAVLGAAIAAGAAGATADAAAPRALDGGLEPLFGAYRKRALPRLEQALAAGVQSLRGALARLRVGVVEAVDVDEAVGGIAGSRGLAHARAGPRAPAWPLANVNTPGELRAARAACVEAARFAARAR